MQETPTISSDEASAVTAGRHLLIDGRLLDTERTFPSLNPATGAVLGHAPDATIGDAEAAVAAARRAFDTTDWSTNTELRVHCLEQFHRALIHHRAGRKAESRTWLDKAVRWLTDDPARQKERAWWKTLEVRLLHREVEAALAQRAP